MSSSLLPRWDAILQRRGTDAWRDCNELKEGLHALRAACLRSFPELLADVKMAAMGKATPGGDIGTGLADFTVTETSYAVHYMERIPDVSEAVGAALLSLGDGNWRMGDGMPVDKSNLGPGDELIIIEQFMYDVINTVYISLSTISKTQKRP